MLIQAIRVEFQHKRILLTDSRTKLNDQLNAVSNSAKNYNFELSNLILELNQKINVCKQKEKILDRFLDEYKVVASY